MLIPLVRRPTLARLIPSFLPTLLMATVATASAAGSIPAASVPADVITNGRTVVKKFESVAQIDGEGAAVRRSIGTWPKELASIPGNSSSKRKCLAGRPELQRLDPFLMLDEFNVASPGGFPPHPHRGQSTVTYMIDGAFEHEDFKGHKGTIGPGDLQWYVLHFC
jgi:hypothetical protein